jgi:hypothetical protein
VARAAKSEPTPEVSPEVPATKGHATPTRKEQEAARRRPLVPKDRRLAARQNRGAQAAEREKARIGMAKGDERYLPIRDKGPQKRYVRDYVDARFSAGEILMPVLVLVILTWFLPQQFLDYVFLGFWGVFALVVIDCIILGTQVTRKLAAKYGKDKVERVRWYAAMRAIQLRFLRMPKPQVKRGEYPA